MKPALNLPRVILVTRKTPLEVLVENQGTLDQARFFLESRGQDLSEYLENHHSFESAYEKIAAAIEPDRRRVRLDRRDLDRFLFAPDDVVVILGQDGLVPNAAKYLKGQLSIGINPDPKRYDGVLCAHPPESFPELLAWASRGEGRPYRIQRRAMAIAEREDGLSLLALNEVYLGHQTHQSARYRISDGQREERHSSSGVICATGTGGTGWARSIREQRGIAEPLPQPEERKLAWFVREPFPSVWTGTGLNFGIIEEGSGLDLVSEMGEGGVVFADGIESDRLDFTDGRRVRLGVAKETLNLVVRDAEAVKS